MGTNDTWEDDSLDAEEGVEEIQHTDMMLLVGEGGGRDMHMPFPADLGRRTRSRASPLLLLANGTGVMQL